MYPLYYYLYRARRSKSQEKKKLEMHACKSGDEDEWRRGRRVE